jgi:hypothetical protein
VRYVIVEAKFAPAGTGTANKNIGSEDIGSEDIGSEDRGSEDRGANVRISGISAASFAPQISYAHPSQRKDAVFGAALQGAGVAPSKTAGIISQVHEAVQAVRPVRGEQRPEASAVRDAVNGVLEANGIDSAQVEAALAASRPRGPARSGQVKNRPDGPPPGGPPPGGPPPSGPPPGAAPSGGSVESALLSAEVDGDEVDELLDRLIEAVSELTTEQKTADSGDTLRNALTQVLRNNGVDVKRFDTAIQGKLGSTGNFLNIEA